MSVPRVPFVVALATTIGLLSASDSLAQVCPWKTTGTEPLLKGTNKIVEWGSTADPETGGGWNISAFVANVDNSSNAGPRNISWPVAGIRVEGLKPQQFAIACHQMPAERNDAQGPLFFGRDQSSVWTRIYGAGPPPPKDTVAGQALNLISQAIVSPKDGKNEVIQVKVSTTVEKTASGYRITYTLENLSSKDVLVDFPINEVVTKLADGGPMRLKPKTKQSATITTTTFPSMIRFPVQVAEATKDGVLAIVNVPTAQVVVPRVGR